MVEEVSEGALVVGLICPCEGVTGITQKGLISGAYENVVSRFPGLGRERETTFYCSDINGLRFHARTGAGTDILL